MPAPPLANTFETGLADGTNITVANSDDGAAGDPFNAVDGTVPPKYSTTHAHSGTLSGQIAIAATPVTLSVNFQTLGAIVSPNDIWCRFYAWFPSRPGTASLRLLRAYTDVGATCGYVILRNDNGYLDAFNAGGSGNLGGIGTVEVAYAQWVRIEARFRPSTTVGQIEWRLYNDPDSVTITNTKNATGAVLGANLDSFNLGNPAAGNAPSSYTFWIDDFAVSTTGWIGPVTATQTLLPDGDLAAGGWTTAPLYSKLNDASDGTFITATAS